MPTDNNWNAVPPTNTWFCDSCGDRIKSADAGYLEWLILDEGEPSETPPRHKMRIVHHNSSAHKLDHCQSKEYDADRKTHHLKDNSLKLFTGPNGLMDLLELQTINEVQKDDIVEIIKRIHIPGYEYILFYLKKHFPECTIDPTVAWEAWWMSDSESIEDWLPSHLDMD